MLKHFKNSRRQKFIRRTLFTWYSAVTCWPTEAYDIIYAYMTKNLLAIVTLKRKYISCTENKDDYSCDISLTTDCAQSILNDCIKVYLRNHSSKNKDRLARPCMWFCAPDSKYRFSQSKSAVVKSLSDKLNGDFTIPLSFIPFIHCYTNYNTNSPLYMA